MGKEKKKKKITLPNDWWVSDLSVELDDISKLLDIINPNNIPGRITLICRMGAKKIANILPKIIRNVNSQERKVVWACDPMHGNIEKASNG